MSMNAEQYYRNRSTKIMRGFERECLWIRQYVADTFGDRGALEILEEARVELASLIPRIPYIGGSANHMTSDLVESASKLALLRSLVRRGATPAEAGALVTMGMRTRLAGYPGVLLRLFGRLQFTRQFRQRIRRQSRALRSFPKTFIYEVVDGDGRAFDWGLDFTRCAIRDFYEAEGAADLLPYVCALDYELSDAFALGLERTTTLAEGGSRCNPRMKRGRATVRPAPTSPSFLDDAGGRR